MSGNLFRRTWAAQRGRLLLVIIALAIWGFLLPVVYATFGNEMGTLARSPAFSNVFDVMSRFTGGDVFSISGTVALGLVHPIALALVATGAGLLALPGRALGWSDNSFSATAEQQLFTLTNQARASAGLPTLGWDATLAGIARWRSQDMATRDYFSHNIPPSGEMVFDVMDQQGYCYQLAGENIGWNNYPDDQATDEIQTMFMNSPDHRANILGPAWDSIGIGAYKGPDGKKMWAVVFADKCGSVAPKPTPKPKPPVKPAPARSKPKPTPKPTPKLTASPSASPTVLVAPTAVPTLGSTPSTDSGPTPAPTGEVAVAAGSSLRVSDSTSGPGLLESIAAGIAGLFFGN